MRREKDPQDLRSDLVIGQGPLHNNGDVNNRPIAVIPAAGNRSAPLGNGSGVRAAWSTSSLVRALPGSIDPVTSWKRALTKLKKGRQNSMTRLNEVYVACGRKNNDSAVKECLMSDQVHLIKARLRSFNESVKIVEAMEPEARAITTELKAANEEMTKRVLQEDEAKVILKSEAFSDREAQRQISEADTIDHKQEIREKVLKGYVNQLKADHKAADDANTYSLLTHEEFHVRLNGIVTGITVGDQLAKAIFDRTGSILETAQKREANALRMSNRAEELINTTTSWSNIHDRARSNNVDQPEQVNAETNNHLEELRKIDERSEATSDEILNNVEQGSLDGFGAQRRNITKRNDTLVKKSHHARRLKAQDKSSSEQKLHLLDLAAGGKPQTTKSAFTPEALAGLGSDELTEEATQMARGSDGTDASKENLHQLLARNVEDDAVSGPVELNDDAFDDDENEVGLRTSKDGYKQLDMDSVGSFQSMQPQPETSDSVGSRDPHSQATTSVDEEEEQDEQDPTVPVEKVNDEEEVPALPEDPDDADSVQANGSTAPPAVEANTINSASSAEKSIVVDKPIHEKQASMASSAATQPSTIIHFDTPTDTVKAADTVTDHSLPDEVGNSDEDLVEDDSPSSDKRPSLRGLYHHEQTAASQHFLRTSLGRENFGFQAISRALGVRVKEKEEEAQDQETDSSGFGTEVKDIAFHHETPGSDMPTEPDPGEILRTLEHNVEKNRAQHEVESTGGFEISSDA